MWRRAAIQCCLGLALAAAAIPSRAQMQERAQAAARGVTQQYSSGEQLKQNAFEPLSTDKPMQTVDGKPFDAQMTCKASQQLLRATLFPNATSDIAHFTLDWDSDLDGTLDSSVDAPGPFAGVCNNGVIACDAGTFDNCHYFRYRDQGGALGLEEVGPTDLGACYCFNASCGNNLLLVNSRKIVDDIAAGIVQTLKRTQPRLTVARVDNPDELSVVYYGQESGCGADKSPEQYFTHPNDLPTAGLAAAAEPGTVANFMLGTSVSAEHGVTVLNCELRRQFETTAITKDDILKLVSSTRGVETDCGPGCLQFRIGDATGNLYGGGSGGTRCRITTESQQYLVGHPERIDSVTLQSANYDDAIRLRLDGTIAYNSLPSWTAAGTPAFRCDYGNGSAAPNTDLKSYFDQAGTVMADMEIAHDKRGEGWMYLQARVREGCDISREEVINGCTAAEANTLCSLESETVDGVVTVSNFMTTGLGPLASSRMVGTACQVDSGQRPWWVTSRRYRCRTQASAYDMSAAEERYRTIHSSFDPSSGNFSDRRVTTDGVTVSSEHTELPPNASSIGCVPMCRTRKLRPGVSVGDLAAPNTLNATGAAYEFKFKECDSSGACPLEPGEEQAASCDCRSNFAQAAALMQTIRITGKDTVCTSSDASGRCLGELQIFPGKAQRCRPPGTQTVGQDCCRNHNGSNPEKLGSSSDDNTPVDWMIDPTQNQCSQEDIEAAFYSDNGDCVSIGEYCAESWPLIGCVQSAHAYCCFNSKLARIIQEQGRPQLPEMGGFGTPEAPNCRGFRPEEFQALDFSKIDLSEYYAEIRTRSQELIQENMGEAARQKLGQ